jgi:uncharacterized membrane protein
MGWMVLGLLAMFGTIAIIPLCVVHDHEKKKFLVGTVGMIATASLYVSPLSIIVSIVYIAFIFIIV